MKKISQGLIVGIFSLILSNIAYAGEIPIVSFTNTAEYLNYLMTVDYASYLVYIANMANMFIK